MSFEFCISFCEKNIIRIDLRRLLKLNKYLYLQVSNVQLKFDLKSTGLQDWDKKILAKPEKFQVEVVYTSPEEFLRIIDYKRFAVDKQKVKKFTEVIRDTGVLPTPTIIYGNGLKHSPTFHDGQHRALALKELGVHKMPVLQIIPKKKA